MPSSQKIADVSRFETRKDCRWCRQTQIGWWVFWPSGEGGILADDSLGHHFERRLKADMVWTFVKLFSCFVSAWWEFFWKPGKWGFQESDVPKKGSKANPKPKSNTMRNPKPTGYPHLKKTHTVDHDFQGVLGCFRWLEPFLAIRRIYIWPRIVIPWHWLVAGSKNDGKYAGPPSWCLVSGPAGPVFLGARWWTSAKLLQRSNVKHWRKDSF